MLGKVTWWDKEAKMGAVTDVNGREWKIFDDMIDDDSIKAKMKEGFVIQFEPNPALDNSAMRIDVANQEDQKQFKNDFEALLRAVEEKLPNTGLEGWCPSLVEDVKPKKLTEAEAIPDVKDIADKAPKDIQEFVDLIIDFDSSSLNSVKETLEDDDALHEIADGYIDSSSSVLWKWYGEDANRSNYIDAAVSDGLADMSTLKKGIDNLLMVGQYAYNTEKLQEAKEWLEEFLSDFPEVEEESIKKKFGNLTEEEKKNLVQLKIVTKMTAMDNVDKGQDPDTEQDLGSVLRHEMTFQNVQAMILFLSKEFGLSKDIKDYTAFEEGEVIYGQLEDEEGNIVSSGPKYKDFEAGKIDLLAASYYIYFDMISEPHTPSVEELEAMGFAKY